MAYKTNHSNVIDSWVDFKDKLNDNLIKTKGRGIDDSTIDVMIAMLNGSRTIERGNYGRRKKRNNSR